MKPVIPPSVLAALCPLQVEDQARKAGLSERHFLRMITYEWAAWRVGEADAWCAACGVDFWAIDHRKLAAGARLRKVTVRVRRALATMLKIAGQKVTKDGIDDLAERLSRK